MKNILLLFIFSGFLNISAFTQPGKPVKPVSAAILKMRSSIDSAMDERDYVLALKKCDALLKISPGDSVAMQRKVGAFFYLDRIDECIAQTPKAFKNKDTAAYMLGYMSLQDQNENTDSAIVWANRNKMANAGLLLNPRDTYCNASKAILMSESAKMDSSYIYINRSIEYADAETKPWARVIKAALYHDDNKNQESYTELKNIIKDFPEYENAYIQLVQIYRGDKMYTEAMEALTAHSAKFNADSEDKDLKFYILRDGDNKEEACTVAKELGTDNSHVFDEAVKMGCTWMYASLKNNDGGSYTYVVDYNGSDYDFIVNKTGGSYNGNDLALKWNMTSADDMLGTIILTKDALDTAHEQVNEIGKGDITLTDKTTIWVSRAVFNELTTKGETYINADGETRLYKVATSEDEENYTVDSYIPSITYNDEKGKIVKMIHIYADDDSGYQIWINNDPNNPQIIKMEIGWTIELTEVIE